MEKLKKIGKFFCKSYVKIPLIIGVLVLCWLGVYHYYNMTHPGDLSQWNKGENAIWLSRHWMREPIENIPDEELRQRLDQFQERGIRYLFPHVCPMDEEGHLPEVNGDRIERLLAITAEYGDQFQIMPWIGGSIATVDLSSSQQRMVWINEVKELVEKHDFPGVNVNIEPLEHGDDRIFDWLEDLRTALGEDRIISFCGIRPESEPRKGDNLGIWTAEDYEKLAVYTDQITVMSYDTGRKIPFLYVGWTKTQFVNVLEAVEKGGNGECQLLWGIPVYEDQANYFDPNSENIRTTFHGLGKVMEDHGKSPSFSGVAVYSGWTMDDKEWQQYDQSWVGKSQ